MRTCSGRQDSGRQELVLTKRCALLHFIRRVLPSLLKLEAVQLPVRMLVCSYARTSQCRLRVLQMDH